MGHVLEIYFWVEMSELDENHRRRGLDKKLAIWADAPSAQEMGRLDRRGRPPLLNHDREGRGFRRAT